MIFFSLGLNVNILFAQFIQQGTKFNGTGPTGSSHQGISTALSSDGNTLVEGGSNDANGIGAIWIFTRSGGVWSQQGTKLTGTGGVGANVYMGTSVAISADGNTVVTGAPEDNGEIGAIWVFTRSAGVWTQQGSKLIGTGGAGISGNGCSVSISSDGNTIVEGGFYDNSQAGAMWVFTRSGGVWTQQGPKLTGTGAIGNSAQGYSISTSGDGNTFTEGGPYDNSNIGAMWVFTRSGGVWTQQGAKIIGTGPVGNSHQGTSITISTDGNTFAEGTPYDNPAGAEWVFTRSGGVWTQQGTKLVGTGAVGASFQGISSSLSSDGSILTVGGYNDASGTGAVWVFTRSGGVWTQQGSKLTGTGAVGSTPRQGYSVAISGDGKTFTEGAYNDASGTGAVWVFVSPPSVPALISPANNSGGLSLTDTLSWNASSGADFYRLQVSTDTGFTALIYNDSTITGTARYITGLSQLTNYYWRVSSKNIAGTSVFSSRFAFRTLGPGTIPTLYQPLNNSTNQPTSLSCVWSQCTDQTDRKVNIFNFKDNSQTVSNYWFELYTDTTQSPVIRDSTISPVTDTIRVVTGLLNAQNYWWRVKAMNQAGWGAFSGYFKFTTMSPLGISQNNGNLPKEFKLYENYPNPFNSSTVFKFDISKSSAVKIVIYDILGREVLTPVNSYLNAGTYEVSIAMNNFSSGLYFYKITSENFTDVKRMMLAK